MCANIGWTFLQWFLCMKPFFFGMNRTEQNRFICCPLDTVINEQKNWTFSSPSTLVFHPTVTRVTKLFCIKDTLLDRSGHTIGILKVLTWAARQQATS
jgi:hypothetical protein